MNNQLLLIIQRKIFDHISTFVNDDIIPPPHELLHLKEITQEACQLLKEIEKLNQKPSLGKLEIIIEELVTWKKRELISGSRFVMMFSSLLTKLNDYYCLATRSLCVSAYVMRMIVLFRALLLMIRRYTYILL